MRDKQISRREALRLGTRLTAGAALGLQLLPSTILSKSRRRPPQVFNVMDFGAAGNGTTLDTQAIQRAIDEAAGAGNNARILIPGGHRFLIGTIELKKGIDFHIAGGAELVLSTNKNDYSNAGAVITAREAHGLQISGSGNIDGQALEFMSHYDEENEWWRPKGWRPNLFQLVACKDMEVRDISFGNAPHWGLHMVGCEGVLVDNITIRNHLDLPNCDGIGPDHCRNVEIRNCDIRCGDDAIVVKTTGRQGDLGPSANIHVHDCVLETQDSGVKIGTETTQDIYDIVFERCEIRESCRGCTIQLRDEGSVHDIIFRDINFVSRYFSAPWWGRGEAISLTAIPRTFDTRPGSIYNILIENVSGRSENSVRVNGTPESRIRDVRMSNVNVALDRWTKYPGGLFDNRPTEVYPDIETHDNPGYSIRFADNVALRNCSLEWGENRPDYYTHALEAENVTGLKMTGFKGEAAHPGRYDSIVVH